MAGDTLEVVDGPPRVRAITADAKINSGTQDHVIRSRKNSAHQRNSLVGEITIAKTRGEQKSLFQKKIPSSVSMPDDGRETLDATVQAMNNLDLLL